MDKTYAACSSVVCLLQLYKTHRYFHVKSQI